MLKDKPEQFAVYLLKFKKSTFKRVVREAMSPEILSTILNVTEMYLLDPVAKLTVLDGVSSTTVFSFMLSIISDEDLQCIKNIFDQLKSHKDNELWREKLLALNKLYNISV